MRHRIRPAGAWVPDGGARLRGPPAAGPRLGADRRGVGGAAGGLCPERRFARDRDLLGPHAGHQHRDGDAPPRLRPPAEAVVRLLRQPEDRAPRRPADQGSGGSGRSRAPRAGGPVRRGYDLCRRLRADVPGQPGAGAADGGRRPRRRGRDHALRRPDDPHLARAVRPRRRLQRAHQGERGRHPRRAGLRAGGPRARAVCRRQRPVPHDQAGSLPPDGRKHGVQLLLHADDAGAGDGGRHLVRAGRHAHRGRLRGLPAAGRRVRPSRREDHRRDRDLSQGHRRVPSLPGISGHCARHHRPARRRPCPGAARRHPVRGCVVWLPAGPAGAARGGPGGGRGGDRGLRRTFGRGQDDAVFVVAALLRRG